MQERDFGQSHATRTAALRKGLVLALLLPLAAGCAQTSDSARPEAAPPPEKTPAETGRWHPLDASDPALTPTQREALERLQALPYLQGTHTAPDRIGVTDYQKDKAQPGLNLYNSGHAPEAFLIDMEGRELHRWSYPIELLWPDERGPHQSSYWRRVHWLPDGGLLAIFEGIGLIRLDRDSKLMWSYRGLVHHQVAVADDGGLWALTRKAGIVHRINPDRPILEDHIARLAPDGRLISEISILRAFEASSYRHLLDGMKREGDVFHTNSIQILDGASSRRAPWMKRGNLLLSILFLDVVCVIDPEQEKVVWALRGDGEIRFRAQHDPRPLPGGNFLLLDNLGRDGQSQVIEFDPVALRVAWRYPTRGENFRTPTCGTSQRLDNGNTLITESDRGRAFEVTPKGEIVWQFFNPHRAGENRELIATLFEVRRVATGFGDFR